MHLCRRILTRGSRNFKNWALSVPHYTYLLLIFPATCRPKAGFQFISTSKKIFQKFHFLRGFGKLVLTLRIMKWQDAHAALMQCKFCCARMRTLQRMLDPPRPAWIGMKYRRSLIELELEMSIFGVWASKYHQVSREMGFFGVLWYRVRVF